MSVAVMLPRVDASVFGDRAAASVMGAASSVGEVVRVFVLGDYGDLERMVPRITVIQGSLLEEDLAQYVVGQWQEERWDALFLPATLWGRALAPRIAAGMNVPVISDITGVFSENRFMRVTHAGRVATTVRTDIGPKVVTVRPAAFEPPDVTLSGSAVVDSTSISSSKDVSFSSASANQAGPSLLSADIVVVAGRGMATDAGMAMAEKLSEVTGAALGATRATCDLGLLPGDRQVGQTGKIIAPKIYIGVGVSGAVQHLAGIKDSGFIAVINSDPDAPIFQFCDLGLVGRWEDAMDILIRTLKER